MALVDSIDSYYGWVLQQMQTQNAARASMFRGASLAADWPQVEIEDGAIYLLLLSSVDTGKGTRYAPLYMHFMQWVWILLGTDIQSSQVAANRGDRYRTHLGIMEDLRQANYPGFCQKAFMTQPVITPTPGYTQSNPEEMVRWTEIRFPTRWDFKNGVLYGTGVVEVQGYDVVNPAVDAAITSLPPQVTV